MDLQLKKQEEAKLIIEDVANNDCYVKSVNEMLKGGINEKRQKNRFPFKRILRYQGDTNDKKPYKLSG